MEQPVDVAAQSIQRRCVEEITANDVHTRTERMIATHQGGHFVTGPGKGPDERATNESRATGHGVPHTLLHHVDHGGLDAPPACFSGVGHNHRVRSGSSGHHRERDSGYLLDNQQEEASVRFDALATLFNPSTFRHIDALGIAVGWRCWEVGAGGPSVPSWLAARVGPAGHVLATDIDVSWLTAAEAGYEVRRHDVGVDPPPERGFDLVHARLVLVHVPQRDTAMAAMISALRPGGRLLIEEADPMMQPLACPDESGPAQRLANKLKRDFRTLMADRAVDLSYGRTLPRLLRNAGLADVEADAFFPITGSACNLLERATVAQIRERLVAAHLATDEEIDEHLRNVAAGILDLATSPMISAWGRRPY